LPIYTLATFIKWCVSIVLEFLDMFWILIHIKGKFHPITSHEGIERELTYSSTLSLTLVLDVDGWLMPHPGCFTSGTSYPFYGSWMGPRAGLDGDEKYCLHQDSIPRLLSPKWLPILSVLPSLLCNYLGSEWVLLYVFSNSGCFHLTATWEFILLGSGTLFLGQQYKKSCCMMYPWRWRCHSFLKCREPLTKNTASYSRRPWTLNHKLWGVVTVTCL